MSEEQSRPQGRPDDKAQAGSEVREGVQVIVTPGLPEGFVPPSASLKPLPQQQGQGPTSGGSPQANSGEGAK